MASRSEADDTVDAALSRLSNGMSSGTLPLCCSDWRLGWDFPARIFTATLGSSSQVQDRGNRSGWASSRDWRGRLVGLDPCRAKVSLNRVMVAWISRQRLVSNVRDMSPGIEYSWHVHSHCVYVYFCCSYFFNSCKTRYLNKLHTM